MSVERYFSVETGITLSSIAIEKLFIRQDMIGMRSRAAVSKSMPVKPIAASPQKLTHSLSGWASFAPIARPSPYPSWVVLPQPMYESGAVGFQNGTIWSLGLPASWVMIVFGTSTVWSRSQITRYGLIGVLVSVSFGVQSSIHWVFISAIFAATPSPRPRGLFFRRS